MISFFNYSYFLQTELMNVKYVIEQRVTKLKKVYKNQVLA